MVVRELLELERGRLTGGDFPSRVERLHRQEIERRRVLRQQHGYGSEEAELPCSKVPMSDTVQDASTYSTAVAAALLVHRYPLRRR